MDSCDSVGRSKICDVRRTAVYTISVGSECGCL